MSWTDPDAARELGEALARAESAVVLTGAGISTPSGIPDFRSPGTGMWANVNPMAVAHVDVLNQQPELFWRFYSDRFTTLAGIEPNRAHLIVAELEERGAIHCVITQNVDRLHTAAGSDRVLELHGSIARSRCTVCGAPWALEDVRRLADQAEDGIPECTCGSMIRPGVVLFGEMLPEKELRDAAAAAMGADLIICIGSSLEVQPAAGLPATTKRLGGSVAILTQSDTPLDDIADHRLRGDVVDDLEAVLAAYDAALS